MTKDRTVVLDNEAIQALMDPHHRKHRQIVTYVEAASARNVRRAGWMRLIVPTTVRVEAAWDRRAPSAARINKMNIADAALDRQTADRAAKICSALGLSATDAHLAAVLGNAEGPHSVVTSDKKDVRRIAAHLGIAVDIVSV
jgi:predicted nucleic acid-binding protein